MAATQGKARQDAAVASVLAHSFGFSDTAAYLVERKLKGKEVTGEDIRAFLEQRGLMPEHPNAWGALVHHLARRGVLVDTLRVRHAVRASSHARRNPVWKVVARE